MLSDPIDVTALSKFSIFDIVVLTIDWLVVSFIAFVFKLVLVVVLELVDKLDLGVDVVVTVDSVVTVAVFA